MDRNVRTMDQVRDDWRTMSDSESPNSSEANSIPEGGVLAALPRARPQRASPRRAAARGAAGQTAARTAEPATKPRTTQTAQATTKATAKPATVKKAARARAASPKTKPTPPSKRPAKPAEPPGGRAPKQGYEPEEEVELGKTVNPPSGLELVESVADIMGELANSGLAAGGKLLKDAFSLLRRP